MAELLLLGLCVAVLFWVGSLSRQLNELNDRIAGLERDLRRLPRADSSPSAARDIPASPRAAATPDGPVPPPVKPQAPPAPAALPAHASLSPAPTAPITTEESPSLEVEIGSRWALVIGVVVLVFGVAFFIKYSFERHWINETTRVVSGTVVGLALWIGGLVTAKRSYQLYGRMIAGAGLAILYLAAYAASALYGLVPSGVALGWMALLAAVTVVTADRENSQGLATTAIVLAFLAPFLLASKEDHHITLFVYDTALVAATYWLVGRHDWVALGPVSFWFTWLTYGAWASQAYRPEYFMSVEAYITAFSVAFVFIAVAYRESKYKAAKISSGVLWAGPAIYHAVSVGVLYQHSVPFLVYLTAITATSIVLFKDVTWRRLLIWIAVSVPFAAWTSEHSVARWYLATLAVALAIYALHLAAQVRILRVKHTLSTLETVLFHLGSLGAFALMYPAVYNHASSTTGLAALFSAWNGALAYLSYRRGLRDPMVNALALAFTFAAVAFALGLSGPLITVAWAAEGAVVIWSGLALRREPLRYGGALLVVFAVARLVVMQFDATDVSFVVLLNSRTATGAFIVALLYATARLHRRYPDRAKDAVIWTGGIIVAANVFTVALLTADTYSYWELRGVRDAQYAAGFARQASVSVLWTAYGIGLLMLGFARASAVLRYLALALLGVTVGKLFMVDLLELDGIYRISGFIALGVVLLAASFLYHRSRRASTSPTAAV